MIQGTMKLLFGSKYERDRKKMLPAVNKINALEPQMQALSDESLQGKTAEFKTRVKNGEKLEKILPEAFAVVRETAVRTMQMRHYDVQLMGGISLNDGKIAEMKTGEGKTLTSTLAIYLNALVGKGTHIVTVNDYLATRDAQWMKPIYAFLGLTVGSIESNMDHEERKEAYNADVTYGTNNEFGFDYLRDNMVEHIEYKVQRDHYFAIVDEVDSILIDEARTPLIISGPAEENSDVYVRVNRIIPNLKDKDDFEIDEKAKNVLLTEIGVHKCEKLLGVDNLYNPANVDLVHNVHQSLKAHNLFQRDVDYVVQGGEVIIVDEFTGRMMEGRRYSDGLHQALEAKEKVEIRSENQTLATITFQNYFRMYDKLSGMTGTADTEAEEFKKIYKLDVVVLPTNKPLARKDNPDRVYRTLSEKFKAIADDIKKRNIKGQPVLLGTVSIENSELLSKELKQRGVIHSVLNAKFHENEAQIVKNAGQKGSVTIATNMAGRGTDIVLGEGVLEAGGLCIIGSERHESRRIDNQLRGRSGRQGDPGESTFYLSLEDDLMRIFMSDKMGPIMQKLGMEEGEAIEHKMVSKAIERAQKRVEGHNFDIRKHLLEYDDVMNKQRTYIYSIRNSVLADENIHEIMQEFMDDLVDYGVKLYLPNSNVSSWKTEELLTWLTGSFDIDLNKSPTDVTNMSINEVEEEIRSHLFVKYNAKREDLGDRVFTLLEKMVVLQVMDQKWKDHLHNMDQLKEGIWTMGYAEKNPLVEYRFQSFQLFEEMVFIIKEEATEFLFRAQVDGDLEEMIPEEYQEVGQAIHEEHGSYAVGNSLAQTAGDSIAIAPAKSSGISEAASKTAGGGSKRKKSRRR